MIIAQRTATDGECGYIGARIRTAPNTNRIQTDRINPSGGHPQGAETRSVICIRDENKGVACIQALSDAALIEILQHHDDELTQFIKAER